MTDKSSRREFLRTVTLAGAAAAAGGVAGCAAVKVAIRENGVIVIKDPELIRLFHDAYIEQAGRVRAGTSNRKGIPFRVPGMPQAPNQANAATTDPSDFDSKVPINNLCGCRLLSAPEDSGTGKDK
jgi:hypothetical protein